MRIRRPGADAMIRHIHFQRELTVRLPRSKGSRTIYVPGYVPVRLRQASVSEFKLQGLVTIGPRSTTFFRDTGGRLYSDDLRLNELGNLERTAHLVGREHRRKDAFMTMPALKLIEADSFDQDASRINGIAAHMAVLPDGRLLTQCSVPALVVKYYASCRFADIELVHAPSSVRHGLRHSFGVDEFDRLVEDMLRRSVRPDSDLEALRERASVEVAPDADLSYDRHPALIRALAHEFIVATEGVIGRESTDTIRTWCDARDAFDAVLDQGGDDFSLVGPTLAAIASIRKTGILRTYPNLKECVAEMRRIGEMHDEPELADLVL